jgi:hypothetical protein
MLKLALTQRGASNATSAHYDLPSEPEPERRNGRHGGFGTSDNGLGLEPLDAPLPGDNLGLGPSSLTGEDEQESGVHL